MGQHVSDFTDEMILDALRQKADANGYLSYRDAGFTLRYRAEQRFGSFIEARTLAGLKAARNANADGVQVNRGRPLKYTRESIIAKIQEDSIGGQARPSTRYTHTLGKMAHKMFGSWEAACTAAGVKSCVPYRPRDKNKKKPLKYTIDPATREQLNRDQEQESTTW